MRINAKGQVTIPLDIRRRAGLMPHAEVDIDFDGHSVLVTRAVSRASEGRGATLIAHLRGRGNVDMTTDEILSLTRRR